MSLTRACAIHASHAWLAQRHASAPDALRAFWERRLEMYAEMQHRPTGSQQCVWQGVPVQARSGGNAELAHLPSVNWRSINPVGNPRDVVHFSIVGELAFRDKPETLAELAKGAKRIELEIDTAGGEGAWTFAFAAMLRATGAHIVATARHAFSAGALLLQCAHERRIHADGAMMLHGPQFACMGGAADFRRVADWLEAGKADDVELLTTRTGQPREVVEGWLSSDNYFNAEQAMECGLVDCVIGSPCGGPAVVHSGGTNL